MQITHDGATYDCSVAVKCENDKYIKLYDESGAEIYSFEGISDFSKYEIVGGSFIAPCDCTMPIAVSTHVVGGVTINPSDWRVYTTGKSYCFTIKNDLISANEATCNIILFFAEGTKLDFEATQKQGKVTLIVPIDKIPTESIIIKSIQITRA